MRTPVRRSKNLPVRSTPLTSRSRRWLVQVCFMVSFLLNLAVVTCWLSAQWNFLRVYSITAQFGEVSRGRYRPLGRREVLVAVKTLRWGASDRERGMFLSEAGVLGQFDHPNVLKLEGVITRTPPERIVTEFMENGPLDAFLRVRKTTHCQQFLHMLHHTGDFFFSIMSLNFFRRTKVSSVSSSLSGCSGELEQGCVTSLRETLFTETWRPGTCWLTPTWSVKCPILASPGLWGAWTTTYQLTLPHW